MYRSYSDKRAQLAWDAQMKLHNHALQSLLTKYIITNHGQSHKIVSSCWSSNAILTIALRTNIRVNIDACLVNTTYSSEVDNFSPSISECRHNKTQSSRPWFGLCVCLLSGLAVIDVLLFWLGRFRQSNLTLSPGIVVAGVAISITCFHYMMPA